MNDSMKAVSKGKFDTDNGFLMIILLAVFVAFCIGYSRKILSDPFLQLDDLLGGIVLALFLVYIIVRGGREYKVVDIHETHLVIRWGWGLFRRKIRPEQIKLFSLSTKNESSYYIIRTPRQDYLFLENLVANGVELAGQIKIWGIRRRDNIHFETIPSREKKLGGILTMMFATFTLIFGIHVTIQDVHSVSESSLITIQGKLQSAPEIKKRTFRSASAYVSLMLVEYPDYRFTIGDGFEVADLLTAENGKPGDQISLRIPMREFSVKIRKDVLPSFAEMHFGWKRIEALEVHLEESLILTLENYNRDILRAKDADRLAGIGFIAIAAALFFFGFRQWRR